MPLPATTTPRPVRATLSCTSHMQPMLCPMPKPYGNEWIQSSPSAEQTPKQRIQEFTKGEKELALLGGGRL
eukprot:scaffold131206_cov90-Phaeocystis_antarctica.AAC.1